MERLSPGNCQKIKFCDFLSGRPTSTGEQKSAGSISENIQIRDWKSHFSISLTKMSADVKYENRDRQLIKAPQEAIKKGIGNDQKAESNFNHILPLNAGNGTGCMHG